MKKTQQRSSRRRMSRLRGRLRYRQRAWNRLCMPSPLRIAPNRTKRRSTVAGNIRVAPVDAVFAQGYRRFFRYIDAPNNLDKTNEAQGYRRSSVISMLQIILTKLMRLKDTAVFSVISTGSASLLCFPPQFPFFLSPSPLFPSFRFPIFRFPFAFFPFPPCLSLSLLPATLRTFSPLSYFLKCPVR